MHKQLAEEWAEHTVMMDASYCGRCVLLYLHCLTDRGCIKRKVSELLEELGGHNGVECQAMINKQHSHFEGCFCAPGWSGGYYGWNY